MVGWLKTFARNTFMASYSQQEADVMMGEVSEMTHPDSFWSDAAPGSAVLSGQLGGEGYKSGWEIMYVRLRGVAHKK